MQSSKLCLRMQTWIWRPLGLLISPAGVLMLAQKAADDAVVFNTHCCTGGFGENVKFIAGLLKLMSVSPNKAGESSANDSVGGDGGPDDHKKDAGYKDDNNEDLSISRNKPSPRKLRSETLFGNGGSSTASSRQEKENKEKVTAPEHQDYLRKCRQHQRAKLVRARAGQKRLPLGSWDGTLAGLSQPIH